MFGYNFPPIKTTRDIVERIQKVKDELEELYLAETPEHREEECIDVLQSVETLMREVFKGRREDEIEKIIIKVFIKCKKRGYYDEDCF